MGLLGALEGLNGKMIVFSAHARSNVSIQDYNIDDLLRNARLQARGENEWKDLSSHRKVEDSLNEFPQLLTFESSRPTLIDLGSRFPNMPRPPFFSEAMDSPNL